MSICLLANLLLILLPRPLIIARTEPFCHLFKGQSLFICQFSWHSLSTRSINALHPSWRIHKPQRKNGLFKKAYELGVLCSVDVAVIIFGESPRAPPPAMSSIPPDRINPRLTVAAREEPRIWFEPLSLVLGLSIVSLTKTAGTAP